MKIFNISIIIPNYNSPQNLIKTLYSIEKQELKPSEIIIVDNNSKYFPDVSKLDLNIKLFFLKKNNGFSYACNYGIKKAKNKIIALVNNDAYPRSDWLKNINESIIEHPECDIFASKIISKKTGFIDSAGDSITKYGKIFKRDEFSFKKRSSGYCFGACAAAAVYKMNVFNKIGFFDEDYFMYYEDVDLSIRAYKNNIKCWYENSAIVEHEISLTSSSIPIIKNYLRGRNSFLVLKKNFSLKYFKKYLFKIILFQLEDIFLNINIYLIFFILGKLSLFFHSIHKLYRKMIFK